MSDPGDKPRYQTFEEFWPYYLNEHRLPLTRAFHFVGTAAMMTVLVGAVIAHRYEFWLLVPLFGYGPAWFSHFVIEKNRPATFTYPSWSLRADLRMFSLTAIGRLEPELQRAGVSGAPVRA